ncbi:MAG: protein-L-isoaspartate(D-aspartate) O-methyltransferase [Planctomycetota bacterium]
MKDAVAFVGRASLLSAIVWAGAVSAGPRDPFAETRSRMVDRFVRAEGITDEAVLEAMRAVPRHAFVATKDRARAYFDIPLPIGYGQTISPPYIVGYMTAAIAPQRGDRVLEVGTGSGYQAAVLAAMGAEVYSIEIVEPLARQAEKTLDRLGYDGVHVRAGDGYLGWPEAAPFDRVIVTCSPEDVPRPLVDQMAEGGRMIVPLGERYQQAFYLFTKTDGRLVEEQLLPTLFVPMTGESEKRRDVQPDPLAPAVVNGGFELDVNGDGRADGWHYQRNTTLAEREEGGTFLSIATDEPGTLAQALQGFPVDGRKIGGLDFQMLVRAADVRPGRENTASPSVLVHYFDSTRRPLGLGRVGPWRDTPQWRPIRHRVAVPQAAREAVIAVGLHGATGRLDVDEIRFTAVPRYGVPRPPARPK